MVAENLDAIDGDDYGSTYLVLGHNDERSSRIDFRSSEPEECDVEHHVACIRCSSEVALLKVLEGYQELPDYSVPTITRFVDSIPNIQVQIEHTFTPFRSAFRNQYKVLWQRTSTAEEA